MTIKELMNVISDSKETEDLYRSTVWMPLTDLEDLYTDLARVPFINLERNQMRNLLKLCINIETDLNEIYRLNNIQRTTFNLIAQA